MTRQVLSQVIGYTPCARRRVSSPCKEQVALLDMGLIMSGNIRCSMCPFLVIAIILGVIFKVAGQVGKVTCDVPSVKALKNTSLTCYFPEDISQSRKDVSVYLYKENENPDAILDCWWLGGQMDCYSAPGYELTKSISRQLTVTIPRAVANQTGTYACQVAGYGPDKLSTCDFSIQSGTKTICDAPSVSQGSPAWLSCYFSENVGKSKRVFNVYHLSTQGSKESVLTCAWDQGSLTCHTTRDYQFDRRITNTATVKIPKVLASHTGTYSCQVAGAAPGDYEDCVFSLDQGQATSCDIPSVKLMEPATLTCDFGVDINKTKTNFNIVHISEQNRQGVEVLKCFWQHNDLVCYVTSGFEFNHPVTDRLAITIPQANDIHIGEYLCQVERTSGSATSCKFSLVSDTGSNSSVSVVVGVLISLFTVVLIIVGVLLCRRFRVRRTQKEPPNSEEGQQMLQVQASDQTTERLQESLSASIQTMYTDILNACYFVPSLYINRNTYTKVEVAGEKVVVMEAKSDDTLRHDHAIQHVLNCLRHLADRDQQAMFVLSQFTCDDYLASVDEQFAHHKLPMPSDLTRRDKDNENFDVLIVHRQYGVVVVVVKASVCTADMGVEIRDNERVVQDLHEAVKQLDGAERMLKHLMADVRPDTTIRKTLMLPNLSLKSLREILDKQTNLAKALRKSTGLTKSLDISGGCLCAEQLHSDNIVNQLNDLIQKHPSRPQVDPTNNDNNYLKIVSRLCGPATRPSLTLPDGRRVCTPSSQEHAVSLTGELFNGAIIHPEHHQLLTEAPPRVFMSGPPGSGKTTSLRLMGKKWLSEGHRVCVLSTWRENVTSSMLLYGRLMKDVAEMRCNLQQSKHVVCPDQVNRESSTHETSSTIKSSKENKSDLKKEGKSKKDIKLIYKEVNLESTDMKKIIKDLLQLSSTDDLFILVDDAGPLNERESFQLFCDKLCTENQNVRLWAASCLRQRISNKWKVVEYQSTVSCPPSLLREKELIKIVNEGKFKNFINWDVSTIDVVPTEGLPVKYVYHCEGHSVGHPFTCVKCSRCVVDLLTALHINHHSTDTNQSKKTGYSSIDISEKSDGVNPDSLTPRLYPSDVLVLHEHESCENMTFFKTLKQSGFNIKVVEEKNIHLLSEDNGHDVWVADGRQFQGFKRKVVVYVEGHVGQPKVSLDWVRLRGVTSCTAQLIWVRDKMPETSYAFHTHSQTH